MKTAIALTGACMLLLGCKSNTETEKAEPAPQEKPVEQADQQPGSAEQPTAGSATIADLAAANPNLSTLVTALSEAGMVETLKGPGPFTVFAPTNDAFAKLPAGTLDAVLADKDKLTALLQHHVVAKELTAADLSGMNDVTMLDGAQMAIDSAGGVKIGPAQVSQADVRASNGIIHVIDTVLVPQ